MKYFVIYGLLMGCLACSLGEDGTNSPQTQQGPEPGSFAAQIEAASEAIKTNPNAAEPYLERAALFRSKARWEMAMADLNRAKRLDTTNDAVWQRIGLYKMDQADFNGAYEAYDACIENNASNTDCLLGKAEIELLLNQYSRAIELINQALVQDEYLARAYWLKGIYHKETGDTTKARSSYATVVEIDPTYTDAYIQLGLLYTNDRPELAVGFYASALRNDSTLTDARYNLGLVLQENANGNREQLRSAMAEYEVLARQDSVDARPHFNTGYIYLEYLQEYDSAAAAFSEAIARYPLYHQAYYNRGLARESMDDKAGAIADYRQALTIEPNYDPAVYHLNRALGQ